MTAFTWALSLVVFDDSFSWALCFAVFGDNASLERTLRSSFGEKDLFTWSCLLDKYVLATTVIGIIEINLEIGPKSYAGNVILGFHFKRADSHRTVEGMVEKHEPLERLIQIQMKYTSIAKITRRNP